MLVLDPSETRLFNHHKSFLTDYTRCKKGFHSMIWLFNWLSCHIYSDSHLGGPQFLNRKKKQKLNRTFMLRLVCVPNVPERTRQLYLSKRLRSYCALCHFTDRFPSFGWHLTLLCFQVIASNGKYWDNPVGPPRSDQGSISHCRLSPFLSLGPADTTFPLLVTDCNWLSTTFR